MQIRQTAFLAPGRFLKGNLHCHTTRSDGKGATEMVIRLFEQAGFDFLALTDHRLYNYKNFVPGSNLLILPGMELDATVPCAGVHCVHVVSVGAEADNGFSQDQSFPSLYVSHVGEAQPLIDQVKAAGNLPILCHPQWSGIGESEIEELNDFSLMEIWNSACATEDGLDAHAAYWDELLCHGRRIYGVASDDAHQVYQHGLGFVRVKAEKKASSILQALKAGAFYASCGPEIYDFYVEDGVAHVLCSPVSQIRFRNFRVPYAQINGTNMRAGQIKVQEGSDYIRAEVVDAQGRQAWTNPIFLDESACMKGEK